MASVDVPFGDAAAVKVYESEAYIDQYHRTPLGILIDSEAIYIAPEVKAAQAGDQVTVNTFGQLEQIGKTEGGTLENNEEAVNRGSFTMAWNELWAAVKVPSQTNIKQMRLRSDLADVSLKQLFDWHTDRMLRSIFNQAAGNTATSITVKSKSYTGNDLTLITGHNAVTAPTSNRVLIAGSQSNDQSLTSSDTFTLDLIDNMLAVIESNDPEFLHASDSLAAIGFLHPKQIRDLKQDATGAIQWYPNALAYADGGDQEDLKYGNYSGRAFFEYANVRFYQDYRVPPGVNSSTSAEVSNTYRAIFLGKSAVFGGSPFGLSLDDDDVPLMLARETFDYGRFIGIAGASFTGFEKFIGVDSEDNNVFVISTFAA